MVTFCRLCALERNESALTEINDENSEICRQVRTLFRVDIRLKDALPKFVCGECLWMMETFFLFYTKVQKSQESLEETFTLTKSDFKVKEEQVDEFPNVDCDKANELSICEFDASIDSSKAVESSHLLSAAQEVDIKEETEIEVDSEEFEKCMTWELDNDHDAGTNCADSMDQTAEFLDLKSDDAGNKIMIVRESDDSTHPHEANESSTSPAKDNEKCNDCGKTLESKTALELHKRTHCGKMPYVCNKCPDTFKSLHILMSHLKVHLNMADNKESQLKCDICDKDFQTATQLQIHIRSHVDELPYQCSICNFAFKQRKRLTAHMKLHSGKRAQCTVCGADFSTSKYLKVHMRRHTGERPFKCSVCESVFADSKYLKSHMKRHTGERPYKCVLCEKTFAHRGSLNTHKRSHSGERPYKCKVCDTDFAQRSSVRAHMKRHIKERDNITSIGNEINTTQIRDN